MNPGRGNVEDRTVAPVTGARTTGEKVKDEILKDGPKNAAWTGVPRTPGQPAANRHLIMS